VAAGEPVAGSGSIEDVKRAVSGMNNTVLCIQGPPGAGKTYTASIRSSSCFGGVSAWASLHNRIRR